MLRIIFERNNILYKFIYSMKWSTIYQNGFPTQKLSHNLLCLEIMYKLSPYLLYDCSVLRRQSNKEEFRLSPQQSSPPALADASIMIVTDGPLNQSVWVKKYLKSILNTKKKYINTSIRILASTAVIALYRATHIVVVL